ncbi:MAG: DUF2092 domain-containing protein [Solidesulfovibrio sp.]
MCYPKASVVILVLAILLALPGASVAAKMKRNAAQEPSVDEKAKLIFDKTCKALTNLKTYSFKANVTLDKVYQDGSKIQVGRAMDVHVQRPGFFKIVTSGDDLQAISVFDGKLFSLALPERKIYGQIEAAMDTDALMDMLAKRHGLESPLGDLLSNTPCSQMDAQAGYYIGKAKIDGVLCDHLFFQGKDVDWQIWVEDSPTSLPRKLIITEKKQASAPQFTAVLSSWKTDAAPQETFVFVPLPDFTRDDGVIVGRKPSKN